MVKDESESYLRQQTIAALVLFFIQHSLFTIHNSAFAADEPRGTVPPAARNLILNGDFEAGQTTPDGWQTVDGLSSFWVKDADPKHGRVLQFDTDVLQTQAYAWWAEIAKGALPKDAPKKLPTFEPKYDTLAGLDGVWFWSDPIPVEKGRAYWLTLDGQGPGQIEVWLHGYADKPDTAFGLEAKAFQGYLKKEAGQAPNVRGRKQEISDYVWKGRLSLPLTNEWQTYSRREKPFRPTSVTPIVRWVRVQLFPYWPPGSYRIDNVTLTAVDPAVDQAQTAKEQQARDDQAAKVKAIRDAERKPDPHD